MASGTMEESTNTFSVGDWVYTGVHLIKNRESCYSSQTFSRSFIFKDKNNEDGSKWRIHFKCSGFGEPFNWSLELIACDRSDLRAVFKMYVSCSDSYDLTSVAAVDKPHNFSENKKIFIESHLNPNIKKFCTSIPNCYICIHSTIAVLDNNTIITRSLNVANPYPADVAQMSLRKIHNNGRYSDVTIVIGDRQFQSHKAILTAFSDVFDAMFENPMEEAKTNRIEIIDIQPDVFQELLNFMYTHKAPNLKDMAKDMLMAADKYALPLAFIEMCEYELMQGVNENSAAEILVVADCCNAQRLKDHVLEFINLNGQQVMQTDGWENLVKTHNHLVLEILEIAFKKLRKIG